MEFLIGCGSSVAAETGNSLLAKIKRHIGYLFHYNNNMKGLQDAQDNLEVKRSDASRLVADATTKFRDVSSAVTHWGNEAEKLHKEAETIITKNNRRSSCLNPWSCYSSSKKAWELTQEINEKIRDAPDFGTTFDRPAPGSGAKFNLTGSVDFGSRLTILNDVLEALKDEKVSMCSICGMGGVGKTTLAKKLIQQVEGLHLFDKVVMVTVSQNPNFEKIQTEIIELLGLKISESTMPARANKLNAWLTDNKTLLILDDVWRMMNDEDFEAIGIPSVNKGRKIVFTSRNEDECNKMGCQRNFRIGVLERTEAWDLFRENAGKCIEDLNLHETARNVAAECGGLPIAIVTIATAVKNKPEATWKDSLLRLQKSNLSTGISDMEKVYARIGLSYDLLDDKEAHSCFRLCCLYPEDYNIPVEDLVLYGKSLDLFESVDTVSQARDRVESIIHKLKASFLLLDGDEYECVKLHDILRDFAVSISSKAEDAYLTKCENIVMTKWPETTKYKNCTAISIMCKKMEEHPIDLECPKLELLQLAFEKDSKPLQADIFEGMKELKVLSLKVPSLSQPLTMPKTLRTLLVAETTKYAWVKYFDKSFGIALGDHLTNLESFSNYSAIPNRHFQEEIRLLCNLRVLRFSGVSFEYIPPGVLPKLFKLEELYLPWDFKDWGLKDMGGRFNASLDEIESLPLTALEIGVLNGSILAQKVVKNLTRFQVCVRKDFLSAPNVYRLRSKSKKLFEAVEVDACDITLSWICALLRKSETMSFVEVRNLKNIRCLQLENNGLEQLKKIHLRYCKEMEYLCHIGPRFSKSEPTLLFPFPNLVWIRIKSCYKMEKIFGTDEVYDDKQQEEDVLMDPIIILPQLKVLELEFMDELRVFYGGNKAIKLPSLESFRIFDCKKMEGLSYGLCTTPKLQQIQINTATLPLGEDDVTAFFKKKQSYINERIDPMEYYRYINPLDNYF